MKGNSAGQQSDHSLATRRERSAGVSECGGENRGKKEKARERERDTEQYLNDARR